jgi:hypothetical protein
LYSPVSQHSVGPLCVFLKIRVFFFFVIIHLFFCLKIGIAKGALVLYWMGIVPAGFRHSNVSDFCYLNLPCTHFPPVQDTGESSLQSRIKAVPSKMDYNGPLAGLSPGYRTTMTEHDAYVTTPCATLPRYSLSMPDLPFEPITIMSDPSNSA